MSAAKKRLDTDQVVSEFASESAFFQQPTSPQTDKPTSVLVDKPTKLPKYTTHLRPDTIEAIKSYAFNHAPRMKDYEVVQAAIDEYLERHKDES